MTERWLPIAGFEGLYDVSDLGNVRSIRAGRLLRPCPDHKGYPRVSLHKDGKSTPRRVHRLVLETFVGARPEGFTASHQDGDCTNNRLDNLAWESMADNHRRKKIHGTELLGERGVKAKLTSEQVKIIRARAATGERPNKLGPEFGVTGGAARALIRRSTWRHLP